MKICTIALILSACVLASCSLLEGPVTPIPYSEQQQILAVHNKYRALHHASKLTWDNRLADYASRHANRCVFKHSHSPYGENLVAGSSSLTAGINAWYFENEIYSYNKPGFSKKTGHFTQLVWKSTKRVGCGYAECDGKNGTPGTYLVCEYSPGGNVINKGYFDRNVLPK